MFVVSGQFVFRKIYLIGMLQEHRRKVTYLSIKLCAKWNIAKTLSAIWIQWIFSIHLRLGIFYVRSETNQMNYDCIMRSTRAANMVQVFPLLYNQCGNSDILIAHASSLPNFSVGKGFKSLILKRCRIKWYGLTDDFNFQCKTVSSSRVCAHKLILFLLLRKPYLKWYFQIYTYIDAHI